MIVNELGSPALHHVGLLVRDLDAALERYRALGFAVPEIFDIPDQGVRAATLRSGGGYVELITPTVAEGGIVRFLESRGEGVHHVAYVVSGLEDVLRRLEGAGFELIDRQPRTGAHGWRVAFIHPRSCHGVLTELVDAASV